MHGLLSTFGFLLIALLSGCASRSYQGQALAPAVLATHRTVAILPFDVQVIGLRDLLTEPMRQWQDSTTRPLLPTKAAPERQRLAYEYQAALQGALVRQQAKQPRAVTYQYPADTNARLARAGITYENIAARPIAELRAVLGVDAVLTGRSFVRQLVPGGVSIAVYLISDKNLMSENGTRTHLDLYDTSSGQQVWHFDHELRGRPSTSPTALAQALVRNMRRVPPYQQ